MSSGEGLTFFVINIRPEHRPQVTTDTKENIKSIAESVIEQAGLFLLDVEIESTDGKTVWLNVDSESGGVSLDICGRLSKEIGFLLDAHETISGAYRLNISSPGLDRPLSDIRQYRKNIGRTIRIKPLDSNQKDLLGTLISVQDDAITVSLKTAKGGGKKDSSRVKVEKAPGSRPSKSNQSETAGVALNNEAATSTGVTPTGVSTTSQNTVIIALSSIREARIQPVF